MKITGAIARKEPKDLNKAHFAVGHHKLPRVWILIANTSIVRIFSKVGDSIELIGEALPTEGHGKVKTNKDIGRTVPPASKTKQIQYEPSMKKSRREAFRFVHETAAWLDDVLRKEAFDRLIIVAPPQTLGDFRVTLSKPVTSRLLAEVNKDLAKLNIRDLQKGLEKITWF